VPSFDIQAFLLPEGFSSAWDTPAAEMTEEVVGRLQPSIGHLELEEAVTRLSSLPFHEVHLPARFHAHFAVDELAPGREWVHDGPAN
jgi:hypothetical protein